ncbi:unnamed protein product [Polarella glacialis]|nr:unnamed protein product [Polarella glacialis]
MWQLFRHDVDLAGILNCLADPICQGQAEATATGQLLSGGGIMQCSEDRLPTVSANSGCSAGMLHYMITCSLQMWLQQRYRQSALYFDHGLGYLALARGCLEGSNWPLWPDQVLTNWRNFLSAAFPPGAIVAEERIADFNATYIAAGPAVDRYARWWNTGPRAGLYCPPHGGLRMEGLPGLDPIEKTPGSESSKKEAGKVSVSCAVPLVWPAELAAAEAIADTFGGGCDKLTFFIAAPDAQARQSAEETLALLLPGASVVDLAVTWPDMVRDRAAALDKGDGLSSREGVSGANQKDLLMFAFLASQDDGEDWVCRVETDSYFAVPNFQRFVRGRGLSATEPWFLGSLSYWHLHFEPRLVFNEQVQCLSRSAVFRLGAIVLAAPVASVSTYHRCEIAPGHRGDIMLALCLTAAGVVPYGDIADRWGREYFLNFRMEDLPLYSPDLAYGSSTPDIRAFESNTAQHWRGKAHVFMPCLGQNKFWASPFRISFHDYKDPQKLRWVHEVMLGRRRCETCPAGYEPRLAGPADGA